MRGPSLVARTAEVASEWVRVRGGVQPAMAPEAKVVSATVTVRGCAPSRAQNQ
jgi:hypothetical protein